MIEVHADWNGGSLVVITRGGYWIHLKSPWNRPLFSERYGYEKPRLKLMGWRLFARPMR